MKCGRNTDASQPNYSWPLIVAPGHSTWPRIGVLLRVMASYGAIVHLSHALGGVCNGLCVCSYMHILPGPGGILKSPLLGAVKPELYRHFTSSQEDACSRFTFLEPHFGGVQVGWGPSQKLNFGVEIGMPSLK